MNNNEIKGVFYVILSGFAYGFLGLFGLNILQAGYNVPSMLFWRFLVSTACLTSIVVWQGLSRANAKQLGIAFLLGAIFYAPSSAFFFMAAEEIGSGLGVVLFFTFPAIVALLEWIFFKVSLPKIYFVSFPLILLGMYYMHDTTESHFNLAGLGLALASAFTYALYIASSKRLARDTPAIVGTWMVSMGNGCAFFLWAWSLGQLRVPATIEVWGHVVGIGVICTAFPILLFLLALQYIHAAKASLLSVLEPVMIVVIGVLFLGEKLNSSQIFGIVTVLFGVMLIQVPWRKPRQSVF